jgi:hypothetical protein
MQPRSAAGADWRLIVVYAPALPFVTSAARFSHRRGCPPLPDCIASAPQWIRKRATCRVPTAGLRYPQAERVGTFHDNRRGRLGRSAPGLFVHWCNEGRPSRRACAGPVPFLQRAVAEIFLDGMARRAGGGAPCPVPFLHQPVAQMERASWHLRRRGPCPSVRASLRPVAFLQRPVAKIERSPSRSRTCGSPSPPARPRSRSFPFSFARCKNEVGRCAIFS